MSTAPVHGRDPSIPTRMTWEQLEALPEETARQLELHEGRVVWVRTGPARHTRFSRRLAHALEEAARTAMKTSMGDCWQVDTELNVFFNHDKNDFRTPDFVVYRCQEDGGRDLYAHDVVIAGEVLSPSNTYDVVEEKKAKYAAGGIPWYWEVHMDGDRIDRIGVYRLVEHDNLPEGVTPLRTRAYILADEWAPETGPVKIGFPYLIDIDWAALEF